MKRKYFTLAVLIVMLISISPIQAADQPPAMASKDYVIGPGDVLDISVWNNEALTKTVTVLPDGKIRFPLIGEVEVGGKTLSVLEEELKKRIGDFVPNPELSVMVQQTASMLIYVIGEVNNPGRFLLNTNINVLQALAMVGGFNMWAKKNKIKILREIKGKTIILKFAYDDVIEGKNLDQDILLKRGDILLIP